MATRKSPEADRFIKALRQRGRRCGRHLTSEGWITHNQIAAKKATSKRIELAGNRRR